MITRKSHYGLKALVLLATAPEGKRIGIKEIASSQNLPPRFLELLFARFRRSSLVTAVRGASGGYRLARAPSQISLAEVILACEGATSLSTSEFVSVPDEEDSAVSHYLTSQLNTLLSSLQAQLEQITLTDVLRSLGLEAEMYWI